MPPTKESGSERLNRLALDVVDRVQRSQDSLYPYFNTHDLKEFAEAYLALVAELDALREALEIAARDDCGPKTTKRILRAALENSE